MKNKLALLLISGVTLAGAVAETLTVSVIAG